MAIDRAGGKNDLFMLIEGAKGAVEDSSSRSTEGRNAIEALQGAAQSVMGLLGSVGGAKGGMKGGMKGGGGGGGKFG